MPSPSITLHTETQQDHLNLPFEDIKKTTNRSDSTTALKSEEVGLCIRRSVPFTYFLFLPLFPYSWLAHRVFIIHVGLLRSCASIVFTPFFAVSIRKTSLHLSFCLLIFEYPLSSMFTLRHLPLSFSPYVITTSDPCNFLTYVCHTCPFSYLFCPCSYF